MSVMLVLNLTTTTLLSVHTFSRGHTLLYVVDDMMITGDDSMFIDFVKKHVSDILDVRPGSSWSQGFFHA